MRLSRCFSPRPAARASTAARRRPRLITALAAATAAAAVALAVAAWLVPRQREHRARAALTDYAGYFVATVLDRVGLEVGRTLHDRLFVPSRTRALAAVDATPSLAAWVAASGRADDGGWVPVVAEALRFRYDERRGALETAGADPTPRLRRWLADTLRLLPRRYGAAPAFLAGRPLRRAVLFPGRHGPGLGVAVRAVYRPDGSRVWYGYVADVRPLLAIAIPDMVARTPLFPRSLRRAVSNRALVSLSVADAAGTMLFADDARAAGSSGTAVAGTALVFDHPGFGGVRVTVAPRAGAPGFDAGRLSVPWLAAADGAGDGVLAGLTALLVTLLACTLASAWIARREAALAATRVDFLAAVSHEFRTPLAQILVAADTLPLIAREAFARADRTALDATAALDAIVHATERLGHLVDNVLHVARGDRPDPALQGDLPYAPLQLAPLVEDVVERFLPVAAEADVEVAVALAPDVVVAASRELVTRLVLNLLDNAVKYGPRPQTVRVLLARGPLGSARLTVDDQGPGVPLPDRARIWNPFVRLARDAARPGSGIGLTVVRDLARRLGGRAWVADAPGGGARFVVELPLADVPLANERPEQVGVPGGKRTGASPGAHAAAVRG